MRARATRLSESGAVLKRLADATEPLYRSLDDAQKRRFAILARTERPRAWHRRGREGGERGMPRGYQRTDAVPADAVESFARMTADAEVYAQGFLNRTVDSVVVGRVFGSKSVDGDLMVGGASLLSGKSPMSRKTPAPVAFGGNLTVIEPGAFGPKLTAPEGVTFGRKITIGEPPVFGRKVVTSI
jgi:hypothetical protein